jgi:uncharacterized protein YjbI with pentapeptide repeats
MANHKHLAKLKQGVKAWNEWRERYTPVDLSKADLRHAALQSINLFQCDLRSADLSEANLDDADLNGADLTSAKLSKSRLKGADLRGAGLWAATLNEANLNEANLTSASLVRANLSRANLIMANCSRADFGEADLTGAGLLGTDLYKANLLKTRLTAATVGDAVFGDNDLSSVEGLESVHHSHPSTIGIDTIYRSKGNIPESFLRGCGVPDEFITYAKSLATNPIQYYSCFISYSTKDQDFADRLYADLQNKGVRCWFAPHDVQGGRKLHERIDEAIRMHDRLLLILSPHGMKSEWVKTEIAKARKREVRDQRRVMFPIRLAPFETLRDWECFDADTGKDSAREIREYFIPDFSNWKNHDSYQEAFRRLIADLKASDSEAK